MSTARQEVLLSLQFCFLVCEVFTIKSKDPLYHVQLHHGKMLGQSFRKTDRWHQRLSCYAYSSCRQEQKNSLAHHASSPYSTLNQNQVPLWSGGLVI